MSITLGFVMRIDTPPAVVLPPIVRPDTVIEVVPEAAVGRVGALDASAVGVSSQRFRGTPRSMPSPALTYTSGGRAESAAMSLKGTLLDIYA